MKFTYEQKLALGLAVLALAYIFFNKSMFECFDNPSTKQDHPCPPNSVKCPSGDCRLEKDIYGLCA